MGKDWNYQIMSDNSEQIFKNQLRELQRMDKGDKMTGFKWQLYMEVLKKYTNLGKFVGDDNLENQKQFIFKKLFWSGQGALLINKDEVYTCSYTDLKLGLDGYPMSATIQSINTITDKRMFPVKTLTRKNGVFFQANVYKFPLFMGLDAYLKPLLEVWPLLDAEITNAITKVLYKVSDDKKAQDTLYRDLHRLTRRDGSLYTFITNKVLEVHELKTDTINGQLWEHIHASINFMNQRLGFLINMSEKRERNITSEVAINELQFDLIRDDIVMRMIKLTQDYNAITGKSVEYKLLQDEIADKEMERQMLGMLHQGVKGGDDNESKEKDKG